jgi:hypothetical protein
MGHLSSNIAQAGLRAGLPNSSVPQFVAGLIGQNTTALLATPGVSPKVIEAGAGALLDTYVKGFRNVWLTALPFVALAAVGMLSSPQFVRASINDGKLPYFLLTLPRNSITTLMLLLRRTKIFIHFSCRMFIFDGHRHTMQNFESSF